MRLVRRSVLITGLLSALLLVSVVLNCYLFNRGRGYYLQLNETRLDPLGLSYYTADLEGQSPGGPNQATVVFLGDSRAESWRSPFGLDQFEFVNRGIGTQTSAQVVQRFDYHVEPLGPQIVVLQVGINDLKTLPIFPERKAEIIANCKANIREIVRRSNALGATVILTTVFPLGEVPIERRLFWSDDVASAIDEVNAYIRSLEGEWVLIFDAYGVLADHTGGTRAEYSKDLLHINARGYEALNDALVQMLVALDQREH